MVTATKQSVQLNWLQILTAVGVLAAAVIAVRHNPELVTVVAGIVLALLRPATKPAATTQTTTKGMKIQLALIEHGLGQGDIDLGHWDVQLPDIGPIGNSLATQFLVNKTETADVKVTFGDASVTLTGTFEGNLPLLPAEIKAGSYTEPFPDWLAAIAKQVAPDGVDAKLVAKVVA